MMDTVMIGDGDDDVMVIDGSRTVTSAGAHFFLDKSWSWSWSWGYCDGDAGGHSHGDAVMDTWCR